MCMSSILFLHWHDSGNCSVFGTWWAFNFAVLFIRFECFLYLLEYFTGNPEQFVSTTILNNVFLPSLLFSP